MRHRSPRRTLSRWLAACLCLLPLLIVSPSQAAATVVPKSNVNVEGDTENGLPFHAAEFGLASQRTQQVYAASEFAETLIITEIRFRPDGLDGAAFNKTLPSIRIDLSTTAKPVGGLSTTFAENVGADNTTVYGDVDGEPLPLSSSLTPPTGGPKNFDIVIRLTTPFIYNPSEGNLLMDVRNFSGISTTFFDAQSGSGSISRIYTFTGSDVNSPTASGGDDSGLVTRFDTVPFVEHDVTAFAPTVVLQRLANPTTRTYLYYVQVKNIGNVPFQSPLALVLEDLPAGAVLVNGAGMAPDEWGYRPSSPYVLLNLPADLPPGKSAVFTVQLKLAAPPPSPLLLPAVQKVREAAR